jgi:hypothetical protein
MSGILAGIATVLPFANKLVDGWGVYQQRKSEVEQAKHEAQVEAVKNGVSLRNRSAVLYTTFWMVSYPYISMFIPYEPLRTYTLESFKAIEALPPIAMWSWLLVLGAVWGVGIKDIPSKLWKR